MAKPSLLAPPTSNSVNPSLIGAVSPVAAAAPTVAAVRAVAPGPADACRLVVLVVVPLPVACAGPPEVAPAAVVAAVVDVGAAALAASPDASTMGLEAPACDDGGVPGPCTSMGTRSPASSIPTMTPLSVWTADHRLRSGLIGA